MEDKGREQGWRRKPKKRERIRSGGARDREEDELRGGSMRMAKVRNLTSVPLRFIGSRGATPPETLRAAAVNAADAPHR
jgi:hypothetical protein